MLLLPTVTFLYTAFFSTPIWFLLKISHDQIRLRLKRWWPNLAIYREPPWTHISARLKSDAITSPQCVVTAWLYHYQCQISIVCLVSELWAMAVFVARSSPSGFWIIHHASLKSRIRRILPTFCERSTHCLLILHRNVTSPTRDIANDMICRRLRWIYRNILIVIVIIISSKLYIFISELSDHVISRVDVVISG